MPEHRTPLPWQRWLLYRVVFAVTSTAFQPLAAFLKIQARQVAESLLSSLPGTIYPK